MANHINYVRFNEGGHTDLLSSKAQFILIPVPLDGVLPEKGNSLLRQAVRKWGARWVEDYRNNISSGLFTEGKIMFPRQAHHLILFPTQHAHDEQADLELIKAGLRKLASLVGDRKINIVATSKLGCGSGGLDWEVVGPVLAEYFSEMPISVTVYIGSETSKRAVDEEYQVMPEEARAESDYIKETLAADIASGFLVFDEEKPDLDISEQETMYLPALTGDKLESLMTAYKAISELPAAGDEEQLGRNAAKAKILEQIMVLA